MNRPILGRPLTKKANFYPAEFEEDEGYGVSPTENSHFVSFFKNGQEDEWSILAKEIDQACAEPPENYSVNVHQASITKPQENLSKRGKKNPGAPVCHFCLKNGSLRSLVQSHYLRDPVTQVLTCPILRKYVCEICGATGDNAHTRYYCPLNTDQKVAPTAILLKTTRNNATGRRAPK